MEGLARKVDLGAYWDISKRRKRCVANKPFNINYIVPDLQGDTDFAVLNGEQISRIAIKKTSLGWEVTFFTSDGGKYVVGASEWSKNFVKETFGKD